MKKNLEKVNISKENKEKAVKLVNDILHSMSFFRENLMNWELQKEDVKTFMGLFESYFTELSPLVGYDSVLVQERSARYVEIRELNNKIAHLNTLLGQETSAESVSGFLRNCDDVFRAWYGSYGFQYASSEKFSYNGIWYDFSDELQYEADDGNSYLKQLSEKMKENRIIVTDQNGWDIVRDKFHASLLDTDNNKYMMKELLKKDFPGSDIQEFRSRHNDYGGYSMRVKVFIPYTDICNLEKSYCK